MMCHLFGFVNTSRFKENLTPFIEAASDGYILNWATIIFDNFIRLITTYRENQNFKTNTAPPFYMSSYIMDAICFSCEFPSFGWKWTEEVVTPIFVQLDFFCESKYYSHMFKICNEIMLSIYQVIFEVKIPRITPEADKSLKYISRWFGEAYFT